MKKPFVLPSKPGTQPFGSIKNKIRAAAARSKAVPSLPKVNFGKEAKP